MPLRANRWGAPINPNGSAAPRTPYLAVAALMVLLAQILLELKHWYYGGLNVFTFFPWSARPVVV